ncbi:MAG: TetR/AcrR family transcriptional regulator [Pseudomonadota bacterium]
MARKTGSHSDITGPRIRAAALRLFAQHGYAAVSMRQIAAEVGVQAGALYLYTPDKQTLLFDLMDGHMASLLAAWAAEPKGDGALAQLEAFVRFHIRYHLDRPDEVFIAYMELRNLSPENFAAVEAQRRAYEGALEAIFIEGRASGAMDVGDVRLTVMAVIAMLTGVTTWYRDGGRLSREDVEAAYWRLVRGMVVSAPSPP